MSNPGQGRKLLASCENGTGFVSPGIKRSGYDADTHPSVRRGRDWVEQYLYLFYVRTFYVTEHL